MGWEETSNPHNGDVEVYTTLRIQGRIFAILGLQSQPLNSGWDPEGMERFEAARVTLMTLYAHYYYLQNGSGDLKSRALKAKNMVLASGISADAYNASVARLQGTLYPRTGMIPLLDPQGQSFRNIPHIANVVLSCLQAKRDNGRVTEIRASSPSAPSSSVIPLRPNRNKPPGPGGST